MNIYVSNLSREVAEKDLLKAFEAHGKVISATINISEDTGLSTGFGYVEMDKVKEGNAAIKALNGKKIKGQEISVVEAKTLKEDKKDKSGVPKREGRRRF